MAVLLLTTLVVPSLTTVPSTPMVQFLTLVQLPTTAAVLSLTTAAANSTTFQGVSSPTLASSATLVLSFTTSTKTAAMPRSSTPVISQVKARKSLLHILKRVQFQKHEQSL